MTKERLAYEFENALIALNEARDGEGRFVRLLSSQDYSSDVLRREVTRFSTIDFETAEFFGRDSAEKRRGMAAWYRNLALLANATAAALIYEEAGPCDEPSGLETIEITLPVDVIEFDGPPCAYFDVMDGSTYTAEFEHHERTFPRTMRFVYRTIGCISDTEQAVRNWMHAALVDLHQWCEDNDAMIVWRKRPHVEHLPERYDERPLTEVELDANTKPELVHIPASWIARARFITTKPMPPEMWARLNAKDEGEEFVRI